MALGTDYLILLFVKKGNSLLANYCISYYLSAMPKMKGLSKTFLKLTLPLNKIASQDFVKVTS